MDKYGAEIAVEFQSTLPLWGATAVVLTMNTTGIISIHAPLVGSDWMEP